ncbi:MAG TPA: hypothetical protein VKG92_03905, partial [Flavobacteriales bacterium]|nr:hypothetical protein [Flavobacteriales bacterium]
MERLSHVVAAMLLVCSCATAQHTTTNTRKTDTRAFADRVWFGGGVGLNFGTVTAIQVEPMAGYFLDQQNKLSVGLGLSYWYYSDNRYIPAITNDGY